MKRILKCNKQVQLFILFILTGCFLSYGQITRPSSVPFQTVPNSTFNNFRGELKMIGNTSIAPTIRGNGATFNPNNPYNFRGVENGSHRAFGYIDIDGFEDRNGDGIDDTESSSSAFFERFSTCGRVVYAGLYWSATYYDVNQTTVDGGGDLDPNYNSAIQPDPRPRFDIIDFKPPNTPTGDYVTVTADRILYDGYPGSINNPNNGPNDTRPGITPDPSWPNINNNAVVDMPYHCYADVTDIVLTSTNPDGDYFVANQKATVGPIVATPRNSSSNDLAAGWTLVIVYEDNNLPAKFISSNYGLAAIEGGGSARPVDFTYSGFRTVDDVNFDARYGIGTYEGDQNFTRDQLQIEAPLGSGTYTPLFTNPENPANNFFDSTITVDGANYLQRNPASENCLGFDTDIFYIQEEDDFPIANSQPAVNFRLVTGSDKYQVFVNTFEVEVIAPQVVMTKRVLSADPTATLPVPNPNNIPAGFRDITDGAVNFNDEVFYQLTIENVGNEDVTNVQIVDVIPANVNFEDFDFQSAGITRTYTPPTFNADGSIDIPGNITLDIDDSAITEGAPPLTFRFRVRVVADCASLRDACSNEIENIASSEYTGVISGTTDGDISVVERDVCDFTVVGASTFLVNDDVCFNEAETARICRDQVTLSGGNGFTTYQWEFLDDPSADPIPGFDQQNLLVTNPGTRDTSGNLIGTQTGPGVYVLTTTATDCRGTRRRFEVLPETEPDNPIAAIIPDLDTNPNANGTVEICSITREPFPEIFLCGRSASLDLNSTFGVTTQWQRLAPGACPTASRTDNCPTVDPVCESEWTTVFVGNTFTLGGNASVDVSGEYRILTTVDGDCPTELYFNVFQSNFDPRIDKVRDRLCGAPGALEVISTFANVEYQLVSVASDGTSTPVGGFQTSTLFDNITAPGLYRVDLREIGSPAGACTFPSNSITINDVNPTFEFNILSQPSCATGGVNTTGSVEVIITNGEPTYRYVITGPVGYTPPPPATTAGLTTPRLVFNDLIPGDYTITAYADDDNSATNCVDMAMPTINLGNPFTVSVTPTATLVCNPDFNPTPDPVPPGDTGPFDDDEYIAVVDVTITSTPVSGSYQFSTNSDFTQTGDYIFPFEVVGNVYRFRFAQADVGSFTIFVRDTASGAGCVTQGGTTINPEVEIVATTTAIDPPCFNEQGSITINVTAGTAPFTFLIDGTATVPATTPGTGDGLGTYTFVNIDPSTSPVVTIQNGGISCDEVLDPLSFTVPDQIAITLGTITPLSCNPNPNASVQVTNITGGSGNYEYSLDGGAFVAAPATPFTILNVMGQGGHTVTVRNVVTAPTPSCAETEPFNVDPLLEIDSVSANVVSVNCTAQTTDVTLSALPTGESYAFTVNPAAPMTPAGVYTLQNGTSYTIVATRSDSNCTEQTIFTPQNVPIAEIVNQRQTSPVSCFGGNDGAFEFSVSNGSTTNPITAFDYTITRPAVGVVPALNISVPNNTTNPVVITGPADGTIIAGTYTITIIDRSLAVGSTGCTDTKTVVITEPDVITFTINPTNQDCATNLNEVSISNPQGGNGPAYTYQVSHPTNGTFGPVPSTNAIDNIPNIPVGDPVPNYTVTVFDVTGTACSASLPLNITPLTPLEAEIDVNSDICLDDSAISFIINIDPLGAGNTGTPDYTYTVSRDGTLVQPSTIETGPAPNFTTNTFSQPGDYEIVLTDDNGCSVTLNQTVAPLLTIVTRRVNDLNCDPITGASIDGRFELTIAGGTANYDITFENTTTTTTGNVALGVTTTAAPIFFDSPDAGDYVFTVTDRAGLTGTRCVATDTGELTARTTPNITAPDVNLSCEGDLGTVTITVTGPETEYFVQFDDNDASTTDTFVQTVSNQIQIPNLSANTGATAADPNFEYNFIVRDSRGCRFPESVRVISPGPIVEASRDEMPITCDNSVIPSITVPGSIELTIVNRGALEYTYTLVDDSDVSIVPLVPSVNTSSTNPATVISNTILFNDVPAGEYYIFVQDVANGCAERIGPFRVASDPSDLTILSTAIATCPDLVTLNVQVVDGVGEFSIQIFDPAGNILHTSPAPLNALPTPSGGTPERNHSAPLLPFNTRYEVRIQDLGSDCVFVQFVDPVSPPSEPDLIDIVETPISCDDGDPVTPLPEDGAYNFTIDVSSLGTAPPVTQVSWAVFELGSGAPATGTNTTGTFTPVGITDIPVSVTDLRAGLYYVIVQEDDGTLCPIRENFEIKIPDPVISNADDPTVAICDTEVSFSITTNGGTPTGGINTTDEGYRYTRVRRGTFVPPALPPLAIFTFDATTINDAFTIDPTDPLDLEWDIYTVDDNNCIVGPLEIDINVTPGPTIDVFPGFVADPCILSDYMMTIETSATALNADGNIFYAFDDGVNPPVFEAAPPGNFTYTFPTPGTYTLIIRDNNGCTDTSLPFTIFPQAEIIAAFVTPPDCTSVPPLGVIDVTLDPRSLGLIGSGAANHTYSLIDVATGLPAVGVIGSVIPTGFRFQNVAAGEYTVRLEDSGMGDPGPPPVVCPFETSVSIEAPVQPDIDTTIGITDTSCNTATPTAGTAPNDGTQNGRIEVSLVGGLDPTATYQYAIVSSVPAGFTTPLQDSNIFNNLPVGNYEVRVEAVEPNGPGATDDVLCFIEETYTVGQAPAVVAVPRPVPTFSCDAGDGSEEFPIITIDVSGGTLAAGGDYRISYTRPAPLAPVVDETVVDALTGGGDPGIQFQTIASVAGTYDFIFKDSNNCEVPVQVIVPPFTRIDNPTVTVTAPGITCAASEEVTVSIEGGTGPFTFEEITGTGLIFTNVALGAGTPTLTSQVFTLPNLPTETRTYRFRITDVTNCFVEIDHTVDRVDNLEVVGRQLRPETCFEEGDGQIEITVSGYTFDDGTTVTVGGDLTYTIIDNVTGVEVVDNMSNPIAGSNGTLTMTTDPQTFTLPFGAPQGNYTINIEQVGNPRCQEPSNPIPILGPVELELILPPFVTTTCALNDGEFTATTNGAQGTVTYEIVETGATSTNGTFTDLAPTDATTPRIYTVIATDTFMIGGVTETCTDTETIEVRPPVDDLSIDGIAPVGVTCNGDSNGSITITTSGTNMPFRYTITPVVSTAPLVLGTESDRQDTGVFNLLSPGDYVINVYDSAACSRATTPPVNVPEPDPIDIIVDNVTATNCITTTSDVRVIVTAPSFTAPYTVEARDVTLRDELSTPSNPILPADRDRLVRQEITNAAGVVTFIGLPEGIYEFFAISGTCTSDRTPAIIIDAPDQVTAELDLDNTTIVCFGEATGSVDLNSIMGGLGDYMYSLDVTPIDGSAPFTLGPQGDPFFSGLAAGDYVYRIESVPGSGCEFSEPFQIIQPDTPFDAMPEATNITCSGETDGTITITASGGNTNNPYRFSLFNSAGERIFEFISDEEDNIVGSHVFEELAEDLVGYTVIVEDGLGCPFRLENIIIEEPAPILIDIIARTGEICAGDNDGTATFSITGGTADPSTGLPVYFWSIDGINFLPVTDPTNLLVEDLPAGTNTLTIRDFNNSPNCESPREFEIDPGVMLDADLLSRLICPVWSEPAVGESPVIITPHRNEVEFSVSPETESLGVIYRLVRTDGSAGPAEYSGFQRVFEVTPGTYDAIMLFEMCERTVGTVVVPEYMPLEVPVVQMTNNPQDPNEYEIIASGGNRLDTEPFYTFEVGILEDGTPIDEVVYNIIVEGIIFRIRETATYVIRVTDANGCQVLSVIDLTYINIRIPNYFRPNDPNASTEERFWYPRQILPPGTSGDPFFFENMEVTIFDRYGRMLKEFKGNQQGWSGIYQGKELPSGDYWFTIVLNDVDSREFTGHFTLYR